MVLIAVIAVVLVGAFAIIGHHYLSVETASPEPIPTTSQPVEELDPTLEVPEPDRDPPEIPIPETKAEAIAWMEESPLYDENAIRTVCAVGHLDIVNASAAELQTHFNNLTACLWQVWSPPLTEAGFIMPRPPVTVYEEPVTSACGQVPTHNAVYCPADQRVYYSKDFHAVVPRQLRDEPFVADTVIAHEFGHAIQARTGILIAGNWQQSEASSKAKADEISRRMEMQADCLAGMFVRSVAVANELSESQLYSLAEVVYSIGDDQLSGDEDYVADHGTGAARNRWFVQGVNNYTVGTCNTYLIDSAQVR